MLNRGGRYFNQDGRFGRVGIHTVKSPEWYIEDGGAYQKQAGNTRPANLPIYPVSLGADRGNHNPFPQRSSQGYSLTQINDRRKYI